MHQALRRLVCSLGPEGSQDDKFAETVLVVEDELVPVILTLFEPNVHSATKGICIDPNFQSHHGKYTLNEVSIW